MFQSSHRQESLVQLGHKGAEKGASPFVPGGWKVASGQKILFLEEKSHPLLQPQPPHTGEGWHGSEDRPQNSPTPISDLGVGGDLPEATYDSCAHPPAHSGVATTWHGLAFILGPRVTHTPDPEDSTPVTVCFLA